MTTDAASLFPVLLKLYNRKVVMIGGGRTALGRLRPLLESGADVTVVAPDVRPEIARAAVTVLRRPFEDRDLDGAYFAVSAAPRGVNGRVLYAAEARRIFVDVVDHPGLASAYAGVAALSI